MKTLTRVRLINWHYFANETISFNGSTLISGENTAGKSTILDAIQLVLTTNTRRFNMAANERGNRDLKGYVRCKTGNLGAEYLRKNLVPANVALEFYEERKDNYFVIGVHMTSNDEESRVVTRWYSEEGRLEDLSFVVEDKPALHNEFRKSNNRIKYIDQIGEAKNRFKRRLGNLEDRFFDIIPKSLAFKPMDNVKDFINKFILPEVKVDVENLKENIELLSDFEELAEKSKRKSELLDQIISRYEEVKEKDGEILVNEFLINIARLDYYREEITKKSNEIINSNQVIQSCSAEEIRLEDQDQAMGKRLVQLEIAKQNNEASKLIESTEIRIKELKREEALASENVASLHLEMKKLEALLRILAANQEIISSREELDFLISQENINEKSEILLAIEKSLGEKIEESRPLYYSIQSNISELSNKLKGLENRLADLNKKIFQYPQQTEKLKKKIEEEFKKRGIGSRVWIVSQLLEVVDPLWQNAVEGYFNTQKFNIIVEPKYFNVALGVYKRHQKEIYGAGIVNTKKIKLDMEVDSNSLAYVIHSENRYAKAYATYVLGRVIRCEKVENLEKHKIAITPDCMLYQGYVVRNIDKKTYENPFIGSNAINIQLSNTREEIKESQIEIKELRLESKKLGEILNAHKEVDLKEIRKVLDSPLVLAGIKKEIFEKNQELEKASDDANYISLTNDIADLNKDRSELKSKLDQVTRSKIENENYIKRAEEDIKKIQWEEKNLDLKLQEEFIGNTDAKEEAIKKYEHNRKTKSPKVIADNFSPRSSQYRNERDELLNQNGGLNQLQDKFNHTYEYDYMRGTQNMDGYYEAKHKLDTSEIIKHEEDIQRAKESCEEIFRVSFLAKMKENIENAKLEFRNLNKALKDIYYGEDNYYFEISYDKKKESLYKMIVSENNYEGYNLWSNAFEEEYKEEMSDLFAKLTAKDDRGAKVIDEYTDYRSFLDYDIEVRKRDGTRQKFSKIYGEKSGGETQTPYYVAIAASFYQLYKMDNTIRIILLDEAFDKMDDNRIASMMDFFNSLNLQVILATPPAKIEVIGEKLSTILMAMRGKRGSFIHEYEL